MTHTGGLYETTRGWEDKGDKETQPRGGPMVEIMSKGKVLTVRSNKNKVWTARERSSEHRGGPRELEEVLKDMGRS